MATRGEIEAKIGAYGLGMYEYGRGTGPYPAAESDALLALLAPEPEPSEREIEAGAKALDEILWRDDGFRVTPYERAKAVLTAARAARQTGGA